MTIPRNQPISITRGDSKYYRYYNTSKDGDHVPLVEGDKIFFTVKKSTKTEDIIFQRIITDFDNDGGAFIEIYPEDTNGLEYGDYVYDIQLIRHTGYVKTTIKPALFRITDEVTYD